MLIQAPVETIAYPESDGQPMAETGVHVLLIAYVIGMLRAFFRHRRDVYVGGNMFLYYQEGDPKKCVSPDVFVVFGVPDAAVERRSWFTWREAKAPDVVFEFTSESTRDEDLTIKRELYERLGIGEYILFDPLDDYLRPNLQGHRLAHGAGGKYRPMPGASGELTSQLLGLALRAAGAELRLFDLATGTRLLPPPEMAEAYFNLTTQYEDAMAARRSAEARAGEAEARADQAEAEVARLRAELDRLKGQPPE